MDYREYGKTGTNLSVIGFGAIVLIGEEPAQAARIISESIEHGINYFDVAPPTERRKGHRGSQRSCWDRHSSRTDQTHFSPAKPQNELQGVRK